VDAGYYHSHTGGHADTADARIVDAFLEGCQGRALDLPCGSGRMTGTLRRHLPTFSADYSPAMLARAAADPEFRGLRADAFQTPFAEGTFGAVVCLRLVFHYRDCSGILRELGRITAPGQRLLVDSLNRGSLRWLLAKPYNWLRGQRTTPVVFRTLEEMERSIEEAGLVILRREGRYLLPTRMYRILPRWLCAFLDRLERWVPPRFRGLTFWTLERPHQPVSQGS
jgi:SAM-dependent methyltransferase